MDKIHARLEARLSALERGEDGTLGREATWLREAKAMVAAAMGEASGQWRQDFGALRAEQQQGVELLEELAEASRQATARLEKAERALGAHERGLRRLEEQFKETPPWCRQLEGKGGACGELWAGVVLNLERQVNEQQVATEVGG